MKKYTVLSAIVDSRDNFKHYAPGQTIHLDDERVDKLLEEGKIGEYDEKKEEEAEQKAQEQEKAEEAANEPGDNPQVITTDSVKEDKTADETKEDKTVSVTKAPAKATTSKSKPKEV